MATKTSSSYIVIDDATDRTRRMACRSFADARRKVVAIMKAEIDHTLCGGSRAKQGRQLLADMAAATTPRELNDLVADQMLSVVRAKGKR